jgi:Xaa-Pro aminopeptidase
MNYEQAKEEFPGKSVNCRQPLEEVKKFCKGKKVDVDLDFMKAGLYKELSSVCRLNDVSEKLLLERAVKRKDEVEKITKAARAAKKIFDGLDFSSMKTEGDVKKYLLGETAYAGLRPAFEPIVASDKNSRLPHYKGANGKIGSIVLIDYGVRFGHYCSDITRTYFLDDSRYAKKAEEGYYSLKRIFGEVIRELPKAKTGKRLAEFSREQIIAHGLPEPIHSIGHGIGLEVHEMPWLRMKSKNSIPKRTTMAIEPGAYFKDYGLRFEETIYFDGKKVKIL